MHLAFSQQFPAYFFSRPAFKKDIIRNHDGAATMLLELSYSMLEKVELFV